MDLIVLALITSILNNKKPYLAYCSDQGKRDPLAQSRTCTLLEDMQKVLAPLQQITAVFSAFETTPLTYVTQFLLLPGYYASLRGRLETQSGKDCLDQIRAELRSRIAERWDVERMALLLAVAPRGFNYVRAWFQSACLHEYPEALPGLPIDPAVHATSPEEGQSHPNAGKPSPITFQDLMAGTLLKYCKEASTTLFGASEELSEEQPLCCFNLEHCRIPDQGPPFTIGSRVTE
jgi:hypothetical protein